MCQNEHKVAQSFVTNQMQIIIYIDMFIYVCKGSSLGQESIVDYVDVSFAMIAALIIWLLICLFD